MTPDTAESTFDIVRRIELALGGWCVLLKPSTAADALLRELVDEVAVQIEVSVRVIEAAELSVAALRGTLLGPAHDVVVITGLDQWSESAWRSLDVNRSALERTGTVILWLSGAGIAALCQHAPNIRSWIGASIFRVEPDRVSLNEEERQKQLTDLASHFRLTDAQVIAKAENGELPPAPEFVEWLILLGRGDLVR